MATVRLSEDLRSIIADAVIFSAKTEGSPLTRSMVRLQIQKGRFRVCSVGTAGGSFAAEADEIAEGEDAAVICSGTALLSLADASDEIPTLTLDDSGATLCDRFGTVRLRSLSEGCGAVFDTVLERTGGTAALPDAELPFGKLRAGIREVLYAKSSRPGSGSYATCGVTVSCSGDRLEVFAVDSARAARYRCEASGTEGCRCVIPADIAAFITGGRWAGAGTDTVCRLYLSENRFTLCAGSVTLSSPTVRGAVFDFERAASLRGETSSFTFSPADMLNAVNRVLSVTACGERGKDNGAAVLRIAPDGLTVSFRNSAGEITQHIPASQQLSRADRSGKDSCRLGVNPRLFRESLSACGSRPVTLRTDFTSGSQPLVLTPSGESGIERTHLLLPVYVRAGS